LPNITCTVGNPSVHLRVIYVLQTYPNVEEANWLFCKLDVQGFLNQALSFDLK